MRSIGLAASSSQRASALACDPSPAGPLAHSSSCRHICGAAIALPTPALRLGVIAVAFVLGKADVRLRAQVPVIIREMCKATDMVRLHAIEFQAHVVLSRWRRVFVSWEKGEVTSNVQEFRYSSAAGGGVLWYEARKQPGDRKLHVSREPFFINSYQNRSYHFFSNRGPLLNGLRIDASCVFQSWATDARPVGNVPTEHFHPTGPWHRILAYQATPLINSGMPPVDGGDAETGPTHDEYRKVPFRLAGATFFTLPGRNRHFGSIIQLLQFDPLLIPNPLLFGWVGGVDATVKVVSDPSLRERPWPGRGGVTAEAPAIDKAPQD